MPCKDIGEDRTTQRILVADHNLDSGKSPGLVVGSRLNRQAQLAPCGGARARLTVDPDAPAHQLDQPATDRQPQAAAAEAPVGAMLDLGERRKHPANITGPNPDAGINHAEAQGRAALVTKQAPSVDGDRPVLGEFDRIADQVDQHLADPLAIRDQPAGHALTPAKM